MKGKIQGLIALAILIFVCTSGLLNGITEFLVWLVTLHYSTSDISAYGEIFVKVATWVLSYGTVGIIFDFFNFHDKKLMSASYFVISTILSFCLCYVVMLIEKNILIIAIVLAVLLLAFIGYLITKHFVSRKKEVNGNA